MTRLALSLRWLLPFATVVALVLIVAAVARTSPRPQPPVPAVAAALKPESERASLDAFFGRLWQANGVTPAPQADPLTVFRRLSLSLHGTIPSLEEIRAFEADDQPDRLARWIDRMLADRRFGDYFARRLARSFVGAEVGQFIVFRRDRFTDWLSEQLRADRPMNDIVKEMVSSSGLWTGVPSTNYVTQAVVDGEVFRNKLAARTVRAFLGQRIDCAECHHHPFAEWKQPQFEGLAACFAEVQVRPTGIEDNAKLVFEVEDRQTLQKRAVAAAVPFGEEWWPAEGTLRERLAGWVTHPENRRFERAMANRFWGLVTGRPWLEPVDDLPNPADVPRPTEDLLDLLGADFREHGYRPKRLIALIASAPPMQLSSQHPAWQADSQTEAADVDGAAGGAAESTADSAGSVVEPTADQQALDDLLTQTWAVFPLVQVRPEQMLGAMVQAASVKTIDQNSHLLTRVIRFFREQDFVKEYGDLGERELEERSGTIPQALLRMNGRFVGELSEAGLFSSAGRILGMSPNDAAAVETAFLCCLARRPTPEEQAHFVQVLSRDAPSSREERMSDLFWTLINSTEFCWSH
jgi:hypothetical protein